MKKKEKKNLKEFSSMIRLIKNDKYTLMFGLLFIFIGSFASIFNGYFQGEITESILVSDIYNCIKYLMLYLLIGIVFNNLISGWGNFLVLKVEFRVANRLSSLVYNKTLNLPAYAFEEKTSGELLNRITNDTETISNVFNDIFHMFVNVLTCIVLFFYIAYNSKVIAIEILVFLMIMALLLKYFNPRLKKMHEKIKKDKDKYSAHTTETIRGIREIKTLGIKKNLITEFNEIKEIILNKEIEKEKWYLYYHIAIWVMKIMFECIVFGTCLIGIYKGNLSIGFFMAMTWYVYRYTWLLENLSSVNKKYQSLYVALKRMNEIVENRLYDDDKFGDKKIENPVGNIEFNNVTFGYKGEKNTLNNFSAKFQANKKIAVIGKSGQGKSTLFNLLTRIFDANKGNIYLDGINIKDLTEENLRKNISIIRQEPFLFNKTIKENFYVVNPDIKLKDIKKYCKMAYLDDYIESLPKKYNTLLGEGGVNLSGGQKQRLSIARALAKESKVILFDEATSALDNESQSYIKKVIDDLVKDHTIIIIAHRLSTIVDSDLIYVVDKGKVAACGTHKTLLKESHVYKTLYENEDKE